MPYADSTTKTPASTTRRRKAIKPPQFAGFKPTKANFTLTPNQFFEKVVGYYDPCVVTVVAILIRATNGWEDPDTGERLQEAELPLSAFVRPKLSESSARNGLTAAIEAGLVVQTMEATNKQPARYALRMEDAAQQQRAIAKQRRAHGTAPRKGSKVTPRRWQSRGSTVEPLSVTPLESTPLTVEPPIYKDSERNSYDKKKNESLKEKPDQSFLPSAVQEKPVNASHRALANSDSAFAKARRARKGTH